MPPPPTHGFLVWGSSNGGGLATPGLAGSRAQAFTRLGSIEHWHQAAFSVERY